MRVNYKSYLPLLMIIIFRTHYGWLAKITNRDQSSKSKTVQNEWIAHTDPWIYQRLDQVPRRNKHPLLTGHTHREPLP